MSLGIDTDQIPMWNATIAAGPAGGTLGGTLKVTDGEGRGDVFR